MSFIKDDIQVVFQFSCLLEHPVFPILKEDILFLEVEQFIVYGLPIFALPLVTISSSLIFHYSSEKLSTLVLST